MRWSEGTVLHCSPRRPRSPSWPVWSSRTTMSRMLPSFCTGGLELDFRAHDSSGCSLAERNTPAYLIELPVERGPTYRGRSSRPGAGARSPPRRRDRSRRCEPRGPPSRALPHSPSRNVNPMNGVTSRNMASHALVHVLFGEDPRVPSVTRFSTFSPPRARARLSSNNFGARPAQVGEGGVEHTLLT